MAGKREKPEEIVLKLLQVEVLQGALPSCSACMIRLFQHHENLNQHAALEGLPVP
jgi:hypothetical protein